MRLIVINDNDGHTSVYPENLVNLRRVLQLLLKANEYNTFMEESGEGERLLQSDNPKAIAAYLEREVANDRNGCLHLVTLQTEVPMDPNPFV